MVKKINEREFDGMNKNGFCVIDFSAVWCNPCRMVAPVLEELSEEYNGKVEFYNIDVDENPELAEKFAVQSIPAIAVLKDGKPINMSVGFLPKESLKQYIDKSISL